MLLAEAEAEAGRRDDPGSTSAARAARACACGGAWLPRFWPRRRTEGAAGGGRGVVAHHSGFSRLLLRVQRGGAGRQLLMGDVGAVGRTGCVADTRIRLRATGTARGRFVVGGDRPRIRSYVEGSRP